MNSLIRQIKAEDNLKRKLKRKPTTKELLEEVNRMRKAGNYQER